MAKTMRAGVVRAFGKPLSIEDIPVPTPGPGEVLIKVVASGVCHTDLHAAEGDWPAKPSLPFVPGHEGAGIIAACGPGVVGLKEGDHAGVAWLHDACGQCEYCMTGWDSLCYAQHNTGYSVNGSFAEYVIGAAPYVGRLPEKADFAEMAPILCAGVTTYKGIKETEARPGEWLAISGIGGLGQLAVQYAKAMGLHVAALDITEDKLALARASGAEITLNAKSPDAAEQLVIANRRRRARRAGDCGLTGSICAGAQDGAPEGHHQPGRSAARGVSDAYLRCGHEPHHDSRLHRGRP